MGKQISTEPPPTMADRARDSEQASTADQRCADAAGTAGPHDDYQQTPTCRNSYMYVDTEHSLTRRVLG